MDTSIEELRAQRDLVRKHLDWLDRQLAKAESAKALAPTPPEAQQRGPTPPEAQQPAPEPPVQPEPPVVQHLPTPTATGEAPSDPPAYTLDPDRILTAAPSMNLTQAKIGCLAFFIGASALFLFLLFGLPYLLD